MDDDAGVEMKERPFSGRRIKCGISSMRLVLEVSTSARIFNHWGAK